MLKFLKIYGLFGFGILIFAKPNLDNFRISIPEFIPKGKSFEVSVVTSAVFEEADRFEIFIIPDVHLFLNGAELWTREGKTQLSVIPVFLDRFNSSAYRISLDLIESIISPAAYFQIVLKCGPVNFSSAGFKIYGEFSQNDYNLGYLKIYNEDQQTENDNVYEFSINFYERFGIADKSASFIPNSSLKIPLLFKPDDKLAIDFWVKHQNFGSPFIRFVNKQTNGIEWTLQTSDYQMLGTQSDYHEQVSLKPRFISRNAWYYINIIISGSDGYIYFYSNGKEFSRIKMLYPVEYENLFLEFFNASGKTAISLDQLRLFSFSGTIGSILKNRHFKEFLSDSSNLFVQFDFSDTELSEADNSEKIIITNLKLVNSDAPIFPRAPEVNLKITNNYYEIEWTGGDYTSASDYILEKAAGKNDFTEIARYTAEKEPGKKYFHIIEKQEVPEIIYFRVKQLNEDNTEVLSEIVKVGQGVIEDVILGQNYPNPFNPKTVVEFELIQDSDVEVVVYNLAGKEVALLHRGFLSKGFYKFEFDGSELPSGIYLYQVTTAYSTQTRKMILTK